MTPLRPYQAAESLEDHLGDPLDAGNVFSFQRCLEWDEAEVFPEAACARLAEWGFPAYNVPHAYGGRLTSYEELAALLRVLARRDLTVALGYAMIPCMAAANVWVAGSEEQKRELAELISAGHLLAIGYHERGNGSDVLASELAAVRDGGGFRLSGEKWVINNARRGAAVTLFARHEAAGGPRGFSLFLLRKDRLDASSWSCLPKVRTVGIRGCDIGGLRFEGCAAPEDSLIGPAGAGFESTLKSFQLTRAVMPALSLGAADTALRATLAFARDRHLYGDTVFAIPHARSILATAFLDLLICEALLTAAVRALHVVTEQCSVTSSLAKAFIASTAERVVRELAVVLGARYYLREEHWGGLFQKIVRDLPAVGLGHAGTAVCLFSVAVQLRQLLRMSAGPDTRREARAERLARLFTLAEPVPELEPRRLDLTSRGRNDVLDGLETTLDELRSLEGAAGAPEVLAEVLLLGRQIAEERQGLAAAFGQIVEKEKGGAPEKSAEAIDLARRYGALHAAAVCLHLWAFNREALGGFFAEGDWLVLALERLLSGGRPWSGEPARRRGERLAVELSRLADEGRMFSFLPWRLGGAA